MIKRRIFVLICAATTGLFACTESGGSKAETEKENITTEGPNKTEQPVGRPGAKFNNESALKYILGSDEYNMWGVLCRMSSYSKEINGSDYTLLCPNNKTFLTYGVELTALLKKPENIGLLDALVKKHIINRPLTIDKLKDAGELETIGGDKLDFDFESLKINGVHLNSEQTITKKGIIIGIEGCIDFPKETLMKQLKQSSSQK